MGGQYNTFFSSRRMTCVKLSFRDNGQCLLHLCDRSYITDMLILRGLHNSTYLASWLGRATDDNLVDLLSLYWMKYFYTPIVYCKALYHIFFINILMVVSTNLTSILLFTTLLFCMTLRVLHCILSHKQTAGSWTFKMVVFVVSIFNRSQSCNICLLSLLFFFTVTI